MTYEEKLTLIISALVEEKKATIESTSTSLHISSSNGLDCMTEREIRSILHKIEIEEKVIRVRHKTNRFLSYSEQPINPGYIPIDILDTFDSYQTKFFNQHPHKHTNQKRTTKPTTFDSKTGTLNISGKLVKLQENSFRKAFVTLLFKNDKDKRKTWSWGEVIDYIEGTKNSKVLRQAGKKKFYPACNGLSIQIALKTGINDFLTYNTTTVQINKKYL